jgi:hypothetical protein
MVKRQFEFEQDAIIKLLLWCNRHCCVCAKQCGVGIEIAHIDPKSLDIDDAIPVCFDCHAEIGHYNKNHPRGRKYTSKELKARRNQIYDAHTSHLVPPVEYRLSQANQVLPEIGFAFANWGDTYPIRAKVCISFVRGKASFGVTSGHYDGQFQWNFNPRQKFNGHFTVPTAVQVDMNDLRVRIDVTLIDIYDRSHPLLPVGYILKEPALDWYFEPSMDALNP